jgi:hypothetical protein
MNLEKQVFRSFRGLQGTFVPATKTDAFVLVRNISRQIFITPQEEDTRACLSLRRLKIVSFYFYTAR